jgi:hypothetical protein
MKKTILTILTGAALAVGSAQAAIVFGNLGNTGSQAIAQSGGVSLTQNAFHAVGFTANGSDLVLDTATIGYRYSGAGTTIAKFDLYSNAPRIGGGNEPGTVLFSTQLTVGPSNGDPITFTLNQTLTAGTSYWLVASRVGFGGGGTLAWRPSTSPTAMTELNGSTWASLGTRTKTGSTWSGSLGTGADISLSVGASPIPEPGTWAAMAIFAGGAAYAGWRRRQQQLA